VIGAGAEVEVETPEHRSDTDANELRPSSSVPTDAAEGRAHVSVLGPLTVTGGRTSRRGLRTSALELIAYLALHPQGGSRDELLEAFWADEDPAKTRGRLYQATRDARRLLGDAAITTGHERYELDRRLVDVDLDELKALLAAADSCPEEGGRAELRERALALFRERPLSGSDYCWAEAELRRLRSLQIDLLAQVGEARLRRGDARGALDIAERGMNLDLLNEGFWRLAFEAEAALGMRAAIDDRYLKLKRLLNERLGLQPAQETRVLYRRLLGQA
jgi:DNA-binding SARP family transcriptional activator